MPSPFPGMDPYLEGPRWTGVHAELSVEIARQLSPKLSSRYVARSNERFVVTMPEGEESVSIRTSGAYPDAFVSEVVGAGSGTAAQSMAVATAPTLHVPTVMPETLRMLTVEIRDVDDNRLVTAIEVLSPVNKRGDGRDEYLAKRRRVLLSSAHLLEIDLLRAGQHVPMQRPLPDFPYFVLLSRAETRPLMDVWAISLRQPLPTVPVPLLPGDPDVMLDLQVALTSVYDVFRYGLTINYHAPPATPLAPSDAVWAEQLLREGPARTR